LTAASLWLGRNPRVPQLGWFFGDLVSVVFLSLYLASRATVLPGLVAVTGRWDFPSKVRYTRCGPKAMPDSGADRCDSVPEGVKPV
jgi:hypothetical protein